MSVNLPSRYRVIIIVAIVAVSFSTLAWSGERRIQPGEQVRLDTLPCPRYRKDKKAPRPAHGEEGRVARELDLRIDAEEPEEPLGITGIDAVKDLNLNLNLDELKGLNARIQADVLKNVDAWQTLEGLKDLDETNILGNDNMLMDQDALEELKSVEIDEDALQTLKDMKIDEEIWNELRDLKCVMDELRGEIESDLSGQADEYKAREEVKRVVEAVRSEMPRVRREVEKAMQSWKDSEEKHWQ